jgi:YD repeat-containing protein
LGQFRKSVTDARGNTTSVDRDRFSCVVRTIIHPPSDNSTPSSTQQFTYTNTFYLYSTTDELNNPTYYDRDANNRVKKITYADQSTEEFTYNNFGQILTHKLRSDGWETFEYDNQPPPATRGLRTKSYPPPTSSDPNPQDHPTQYFYYTSGPSTDRLYMVIDPRGNATAYEYNLRGEVTKVQHQDGTYAQSGYNDDGTLAWTADENHPGAATDVNQRTRYTYDEYKRVLTVKNLLNETTTNYYGLDWANPLVHTTNSVKYTLSPMNKNVVFDYDANFRKIDQVAALGTADEAWTLFEYDEVGNLTKTTDPRWNETRFGYDDRNRKIWMDDSIASDRNSSGHTMNWEYDPVGNKKKETRADNAFRSWDYDSMNRLAHAIDWRMNVSEPAITTSYTRDVQDLTESITDAKGAVYTFTFDALHRKTSETYPPDLYGASRSEAFKYDAVGNLILYKNPANQYKHLDYADSYDSRNRLRHVAWSLSASDNTPDLSVGQETRTGYDDASRMTNVTTNAGETTVAFGYDDANRQVWEDQTLSGYPTRRISTPRDADGNRHSIDAAGINRLIYQYSQRNQLSHMLDGDSSNPFYDFSYDAAGNETQRQSRVWYTNVTNFEYDSLNRVITVENGTANWIFGRSHYQYDNVGREVTTWREDDHGLGGSRGERFEYESTNQIKKASYDAENVWTGTAQNAVKTQDYTYTPDRLNRQTVNDNGTISSYSASLLNQCAVNGAIYNYDYNFNLREAPNWGGAFDAQNQLVAAGHGGNVGFFTYDGLGRCVRRTVYVPSGASNTVLYTYDGWNPVLEWDGAGNYRGSNIYGARPDEILVRWDTVTGGAIYKPDAHGNVMAVLDMWGNIAERYSYEVFGKVKITGWWDSDVRTSSWLGNRFMFQGREWIAELGFLRLPPPGV